MGARSPARVLWFSVQEAVPEGAYLRGDELRLRCDGREQSLCARSELVLRGMHNVANVLAAACCAGACGVGLDAQRRVAATFRGVAHRLETVRVHRGVTYVNDSIATSPERVVAALLAYDEPLILLAGGKDKNLDWVEWADLAWRRARAIIVFGEAQGVICQALEGAARRAASETAPVVRQAEAMEQAVEEAARLAVAGDVVLLSPGGTSFDAFVDFEARGERFHSLVRAM
jgi:UDP-N-acetylmuramoylalanine--D-glutamate ligase